MGLIIIKPNAQPIPKLIFWIMLKIIRCLQIKQEILKKKLDYFIMFQALKTIRSGLTILGIIILGVFAGLEYFLYTIGVLNSHQDSFLLLSMGLIYIKPKHYSYQNKLASREVFKNYFSTTELLTERKSTSNLHTVGVIHNRVDKLIENPYLLAPIKLTSHAKKLSLCYKLCLIIYLLIKLINQKKG
jgi:hypothetical protein